MLKQTIIILVLIGTVSALAYFGIAPDRSQMPNEDTPKLELPKFSLPTIDITTIDESILAAEMWTVFKQYLEFARVNDLEGVKSLSYQMSATCLDLDQREECNTLMSNVYNVTSDLKPEDFNHVMTDGRQIALYTDGPARTILHFVRTEDNTPKLLGISVCLEIDSPTAKPCVETDPVKRDMDKNGWWDAIEEKFYDTTTQ